jgi:hypothetical protein
MNFEKLINSRQDTAIRLKKWHFENKIAGIT